MVFRVKTIHGGAVNVAFLSQVWFTFIWRFLKKWIASREVVTWTRRILSPIDLHRAFIGNHLVLCGISMLILIKWQKNRNWKAYTHDAGLRYIFTSAGRPSRQIITCSISFEAEPWGGVGISLPFKKYIGQTNKKLYTKFIILYHQYRNWIPSQIEMKSSSKSCWMISPG